MSSRWTGFFVWALAAACAAFWGLRIFAATRPVPAGALVATATLPPSGPMEKLFGVVVVPQQQEDAPAPESDRFQLVGVIAPTGGTANAMALVAVDGQPARPWHVGSVVDADTRLLAVGKRTADFGPEGGPAAFTLTLPEPTAAQTGTLPVATNGGAPGGGDDDEDTPRVVGRPVGQTLGRVPPNGARGAQPMANFHGRPNMPGMIPPNVVPPGRSMPTAGAAQVQPMTTNPDDDGTENNAKPDEE